MTFEIPRLVPSTPDEFIEFWSAQYSYELEPLYEEHIGKPLTEERVWALYKWKNGGDISAPKMGSIQRAYITQLNVIPNLADQDEARAYASRLEGGPIWNIFWLHCIAPDLFPIFDQHTYRAMYKIREGVVAEIPTRSGEVIATYFESYIPFAQDLPRLQRATDRALFAYGRFLKNGYSKK
jgi:hypothetical protein